MCNVTVNNGCGSAVTVFVDGVTVIFPPGTTQWVGDNFSVVGPSPAAGSVSVAGHSRAVVSLDTAIHVDETFDFSVPFSMGVSHGLVLALVLVSLHVYKRFGGMIATAGDSND